MSAAEADRAARLLERLLTDAEFRARFRRDPAATCRQAGLDDIADEMALGAGKAMMTLDVRESKSSLAGVMMAAAMEGAGLYQLSANVFPRLDDVPAAVGDVLSRVDLPSVRGALAAEPPATGATAVGAAEPSATGATAVGAAEPSATGATAVGPAEPSATGETAEAPPAQEAAGRATAGDTSQVGERGAGRGGSAIDEQAQAPRGADDLPDAPVEPRRPEGAKRGEEPASARAEPSDAETAPAPARTQPQAAAAETAPTSGASGEPRPDPDQYGMAGGGGEASAQARAVLANDRIQLDANGREDFAKGRMDPRVATILLELAEEHTVTVSSTTSDHPQNTSGGSVSNHWFGRGLDIATIDGEPVNAGSTAARKVASQLAELHQSIRPTEVGTPWAIAAPGFFTDAGHQDHIHLAFDDPIAADWTPPDGPPVTPESPTSPATADPSSGAAAAPSPLPRRPGDSLTFAAVSRDDAAATAAGGRAGEPRSRDSLLFIGAVQADRAPPAPAPPEPTAAASAPISGPSEYPGDDAPREQLAAWMAAEAQRRGISPELPVMAALVESNLQNLNYGDADSVGFFQMRVGIWNTGEYAGYPDDPQKQIDWFLDTAQAVMKQRRGAGLPVDDPSQYGEWIADVERPAEQYRGRYQLRLDEARGLLDGADDAAARNPAAATTSAGRAGEPPAVTAPEPIDPVQFGAEGEGGEPDAAARALLKNPNVVLDDTGVADVKAGRIDPRIIAVLTKLSEDHEITVSSLCSDHPQFTSGGSVSNHWHGRGLDIAAVDGVPVNAANFDAREIAAELQEFDSSIRPDEIGTPWAIAGPGYFTDAGHQDHLHIGFKQQITPDWKPPAELAPAGQPVAAAAAVRPPGVAQPPPAPAPKVGDSLAFAALTPEQAAAASAEATGAKPAPSRDSLSFLRSVATRPQPAGPASALADPAAAPAAVPDAAAAAAAGGSRLGASALEVAAREVGVREVGNNAGVDVEKYLAAAGVPPGSPWCASFVTWALEQAGHKMEGGGWAAVQTWVRNAEQGNYDLEIVSAEEARPGDLIAYDWGGQDDFGADAHMGFVASNVDGGKFTAVEGNWQDAVLRVPRQVGSDGTNMKFLRIKGGAPPAVAGVEPPAAAVAPPAVEPPAAAVAPPAVAPPAVEPDATAERQAAVAREAPEVQRNDSLVIKAVTAHNAAKARATVQFLKAIKPEQAKAAAAAPVVAPDLAAQTPAASDAAAPDLSAVDSDYPGDEASQAQLAKWLAKQAERAGLPPELPVMAALVESGVKNLNYGDADSVGFFQMRTSIWNSGPYAGYPERPELQAKWFIDNARAIKKKRIAAGDVDFGKDPSGWGEWIADVERPAEQYRGRYQLRLAEARKLLA